MSCGSKEMTMSSSFPEGKLNVYICGVNCYMYMYVCIYTWLCVLKGNKRIWPNRWCAKYKSLTNKAYRSWTLWDILIYLVYLEMWQLQKTKYLIWRQFVPQPYLCHQWEKSVSFAIPEHITKEKRSLWL